jgi:sodium/potassium/calcium exchanger 6
MILFLYQKLSSPLYSAENVYLGTLPMWLFPISIVLSIIIWRTTTESKPPIYNPILMLLGLVMSIVWISAAADELVECLGVLGEIVGIPRAILGLTVLAWGNSIGDFVSDVLIARKGYPAIATSSVYSSPITHLLLGLGISFITKTQGGTIVLSHDDTLSNTLYFNFLFLIFGLLFTLVSIPLSGFSFTRIIGVVLICTYILSMIIIVLDLMHVILPTTKLWEY